MASTAWCSPRVALALVGASQLLFSSGLFLGWSGALLMLQGEGSYDHLCQAGRAPCVESELALATIYSAAGFAATGAPFFLGMAVDWLGPRVGATICAVGAALGCLLIGVSRTGGDGSQDFLLPGFVVLGGFGSGVQFAAFHIANLFPEHHGVVTGVFSGMFGVSSLIFPALHSLWATGVATRADLFTGYSVVLLLFALVSSRQPKRLFELGDVAGFSLGKGWFVAKRAGAPGVDGGAQPTSAVADADVELKLGDGSGAGSGKSGAVAGTSDAVVVDGTRVDTPFGVGRVVGPAAARGAGDEAAVICVLLDGHPHSQVRAYVARSRVRVVARVRASTGGSATSPTRARSGSSAHGVAHVLEVAAEHLHHGLADGAAAEVEAHSPTAAEAGLSLSPRRGSGDRAACTAGGAGGGVGAGAGAGASVGEGEDEGEDEGAGSGAMVPESAQSHGHLADEGLVDAPLRVQLLSVHYVAFVVYMAAQFARYAVYLGSVNLQLRLITGGEAALPGREPASNSTSVASLAAAAPESGGDIAAAVIEADDLTNVFAWIAPFGVLSTPFVGRVCDLYGTPRGFALGALLGLLHGACAMVPVEGVQVLTFALYTLGQEATFAVMFAHVGRAFGYAHYGSLAGIGLLGVSVVVLLVAPVIESMLDAASPLVAVNTVNGVLQGLGLVTLAYPAWMEWKAKRQRDAKAKAKAGAAPLTDAAAERRRVPDEV